MGNLPVWSEYDLHMLSIDATVHIMSLVLMLLGSWLGDISAFKSSVCLVERRFLNSWSR